MRKRRAKRRPIYIVCPSHWLADCVRRSTLVGDWPLMVIPNPIDLNVWAPSDQAETKALLSLPAERPLVWFGAMGGSTDPCKGAHLILEALQIVQPGCRYTACIGGVRPEPPGQSPILLPIHCSAHRHVELSMHLLYVAADVFVIPSRQDNLPNTGLEAHARGIPVVAFATGGLADIVNDHSTGALAGPFDPLSLAAVIRWVLEDPHSRQQLGAAPRQRAELLWDPERVVGLYEALYRNICVCS